MKHRTGNVTRIWILVVSAFCLASGALADYPPETEEHLIDAGSYRLFVRVLRGEGPVVLLEAGGGGDSSEYKDLAPRIHAATGATVVAYDRPGFGQSDLPDIPCDMREESQSLWRALKILGLDHEVGAAGISYGGWMTRLHASDHPDQVVGIVFLDPFNARFVDAMGVEYCDRHPIMGKLPFADLPPQELTRYQKGLVRMVEGGLGAKTTLMRETRIRKGIPVRLLTSAIPFLPKEAEQKAWRRAHEQIVEAIPGAELIVADKSSHMIIFDQPDLVLEQIRQVVAEVRDR